MPNTRAWNNAEVAGNFIQAGIGAVARTGQSKLRESVSVKDFGAVGDGVADDAAEIQAAIDAVFAAGGGEVRAEGVFAVGSQVIVKAKVQLIGAGNTSDNAVRGATCLLRTFVGASATVLASGDDAEIRNLDIDNNNQGTGECLKVTGSRYTERNVSTRKSGGIGALLGGTGTNTNIWRIYNKISLNNSSHGFYITDADAAIPDVNAGTLMGYDGASNGGDGLRINNAFDNDYFGVVCQTNTGYGVNLVGTAGRKCQGQRFWAPYCELNTAGEFLFGANSDYCAALFYRTGSVVTDDFVDSGTNNFILGHNNTNVSGYYIKNVLKHKMVRVDDPVISGYWDLYKNPADRTLTIELGGTSVDPGIVLLKHNDSSKSVRFTVAGANCGTWKAVTFPGAGGAVSIDASDLNWGYMAVTDTTAFTISNPTNGQEGQQLAIEVRNISGGAMGAITWSANFMLAGAFTNPASNKRRTITFVLSNGLWIESSRAAADI